MSIIKKKHTEINVAERNLNPKAACLKRREEEKAEDGPKLGPGPPHHMLPGAPHYPTIPVSFPVVTVARHVAVFSR